MCSKGIWRASQEEALLCGCWGSSCYQDSSIKQLPWLPSAMDSHSEVRNELNPSVPKLLFDHAIYDSGRKRTNANAARWMNWSLTGV